jgi:hypothetical protein
MDEHKEHLQNESEWDRHAGDESHFREEDHLRVDGAQTVLMIRCQLGEHPAMDAPESCFHSVGHLQWLFLFPWEMPELFAKELRADS